MMLRLGLAMMLLIVALAGPAQAHRLRLFATVVDDGVEGYAFFVGGIRPAGLRLVILSSAGDILHEGLTGPDGAFRWEPPAPSGLPDGIIVQVDAQDGHVAQIPLGAAPVTLAAAPDDDAVTLAVRREIAPLLARIEEMDARLRLVDLLSGLFLIFGAAGALLWLRRPK